MSSSQSEFVKQENTVSHAAADLRAEADHKINEVIVIDDRAEVNDADAEKSSSVWGQTKDMAENIAGVAGNVSHQVYNKGNDICGAMKHGAEAGWNKVLTGE